MGVKRKQPQRLAQKLLSIRKYLKLTQEEALSAAQHKAEEQGTKFDPASVTGPVTKYRIRGIGVQIAP